MMSGLLPNQFAVAKPKLVLSGPTPGLVGPNLSTRNPEGSNMMEFDRYEGESVTLVLGEHVIQVKLMKLGNDRARLGIQAPTGAIMFRNEKLAYPVETADIAETVIPKAAQSTNQG